MQMRHKKSTGDYLLHGATWLGERRGLMAVLVVGLVLFGIGILGHHYRQERHQREFAEAFYTTSQSVTKTPVGETEDAHWAALAKKFPHVEGKQWVEIQQLLILVKSKDWPKAQGVLAHLIQNTEDLDLRVLLLFAAAHSAENNHQIDQAQGFLDQIVGTRNAAYLSLARLEKGRLWIQNGKLQAGKQQLESLLKDRATGTELKSWINDLLLWIEWHGQTQS